MSDRQKKIIERVKLEDEITRFQTENIRKQVLEYLMATKGYAADNIEMDKQFDIHLDGKTETSSVDFIIKTEGRRLMAIKCTPTALESRERHILAFGRAADTYQIPISIVTDGTNARVLNTPSGMLISETLSFIPSREEIDIGAFDFEGCPEPRLEKEKRILLAFDVISCH